MRMNKFKMNKDEILYNIINSAIAGSLVFLGSVADGSIGNKGIAAAVGIAGLVAITKFQAYWKDEKQEYTKKISKAFTFI